MLLVRVLVVAGFVVIGLHALFVYRADRIRRADQAAARRRLLAELARQRRR